MGKVTVKPGDTLTSIAERAGMNVLDVIAQNPQFSNPNLIRPGQSVSTSGKSSSPQQRESAAQKMLGSPSGAAIAPKQTVNTTWDALDWRHRVAPWYDSYSVPTKEQSAFRPNQAWNQQQANETGGPNPAGEPLPSGAAGWDQGGRPIYDTGIKGWLKSFDASQSSVDRWRAAEEDNTGSFADALWDGIKAAAVGAGELFLAVAKPIERGIGTIVGLRDVGEDSRLPGIDLRQDVPEQVEGEQAEEVTGPHMAGWAAPTLGKGPERWQSAQEAKDVPGSQATKWLDALQGQTPESWLNRTRVFGLNIADQLVNLIPPVAIYNAARAVTAPGSFADKKVKAEANYKAAEIAYTNAIDPAVRAEFMRRFAAGENPKVIAAELENPTAEFVGLMIFDPLNLWGIGGKQAAGAARLANAKSRFYYSDEIVDAVRGFRTGDEASAIASLTRFSEASAATATRTITNRAEDIGLLALTENGKRAALVDTAGAVAQSIAHGLDNPDDVLHIFKALTKRMSGATDEVFEATAELMAISKKAKFKPEILFSPASFDLGYVLRSTVGDDAVKFFDETVELLAKGDKAAVADEAYRVFDKAAEKIYPSVSTRLAAGEELGWVVKTLNELDKGFLGPVFKFANNIFSHIYMGLSPGYAARNAIMDNFLIALDMGPTNPFTASTWHDVGQRWMGGATVRAAERGISSPVLAAGVRSREGIWGTIAGPFLKVAEKVEKNSAKLIVGKSLDRTMRRLLNKGLPTLDPLIRAGLGDDAARFLVNATVSAGGDARYAADLLRTREVNAWQHMSFWASPEDIRALDGMGMLSQVEDNLLAAQNIGEARAGVGNFFDEIESIASDALGEMPTVSRSNPALPDAIALTESGAGDAAKLKFGAVIESNNNSMVASMDAMKAARQQAAQVVNRLPPEAQQELVQIMRKYTVDDSAWGQLNNFATQNSDAFQAEISRIRKARKDLDLVEEWDKLGLGATRGEPSVIIADTSIPFKNRKREFLRLAQDSFVDMKYDFWKNIREELWRQTNSMYDEVGKLIPLDPNALAEASTWYSQADNYANSFPFSDGLHYWRAPTPRFAVGGAGGETVFAALDDGITNERHFLNTINKQDEAGEFLYRSEGASKKTYKDLAEVDSETAYDVLYTRRYGKTQERIAAEGAEAVVEAGYKGFAIEDSIQLDADEIVIYTQEAGPAGDTYTLREAMDRHDDLVRGTAYAGEEGALERALATEEAGAIFEELEKKGIVPTTEAPTGIAAPITREAAEETFTVYQARPAGFDPMGGYSTSWTKDIDYARNYAGERGQIFTKEVTKDEWLEAVARTKEEGAIFASSDKAASYGLVEGRFPEEFAAGAEPIGKTVTDLDKEYAELNAKLWAPEDKRDVAQDAIRARMAEIDDVLRPALEPTQIPPPPTLDGQPTLARALYDQREGIQQLRQSVMQGLEGASGTLKFALGDEAEAFLKLWEESAEGIVNDARILAQDVATQERDFILHDYRARKNLDTITSYAYPYQFWYTQTYKKMLQRISSRPAIVSQYLRYKDYLAKLHADAPDWWKYNVNTNELLGLDFENPLYFNLERAINPLNGLTDVDFDDPAKRTGWFTSLLADMNKFGPSTHTLYSLAVALGLYAKGEQDAANRWAGRLIPQTRAIKSFTSLAFDKPVELDPWVVLMAGGLDPYERNRVGRALSAMSNEEIYSDAQIIDAAYKQDGPIWEEAILRATQERAPGQLSSFLLGAGFKGRTESDIQIDHFYNDWYKLWEMEPNLSPAELQSAMSDMRETYPFMDALLISKKGSLDRDRAYAYNVMSRIPPSMSDDIAKAADMNPELLGRFYDDKGHMEEWPGNDADRFMAGIVDIAAVLDMPSNATRTAWLAAKDAYRTMLKAGSNIYGEDVWELQDAYYAQMGDTPEEREEAYAFLADNPNLEAAMQWKNQTIMFSPTLSAYYTSLDKIESYYKGEMYNAIEAELGSDIWDKWDAYNDAKDRSSAEARRYWKAHPELGKYMDIKEDWESRIAENTIHVGSLIKPGPGPTVRDVLGEMGIGAEGVIEAAEQYPPGFAIPPEMLEAALGPAGYRLYQDGPPYPAVLERKLEQLGIPQEVSQ